MESKAQALALTLNKEEMEQSMNEEIKSRLIPVTKWNQYHPWPSIGGIRHLIEHRKKKKCEQAFVKAGGRWLIIEDAFFAWVYSSKEV